MEKAVGMGRGWQAAVVLACWGFGGIISLVEALAAESPPDAVVPLAADVRVIPNVEMRWQSSAGVEQIARVHVQYYLKGSDVVLFPVWAILGPVEKQTPTGWEKLVLDEPLPTEAPMTLRFRVCNLLAKDRVEVAKSVRELLAQTHGVPKETFRFHQPKMALPAFVSLWVSLEGQGERVVSQTVRLDRVHAEGPQGEYVRISLAPADLKNASQILGKPVAADRLQVQIEMRVFSQLETKRASVSLDAISHGWTQFRQKIQSAASNQAIDYLIFPPGGQAEAELLLRHYLMHDVSLQVAVREGEKADLTSMAELFLRHACEQLQKENLNDQQRVLLLLDREIGLAGTVGEIKTLAAQGKQQREEQLKQLMEKSSKIEAKAQANLEIPTLALIGIGPMNIAGTLSGAREKSQRHYLDQANKALDEFSQLLEGRLPTLRAMRLDDKKQQEVIKTLRADYQQQSFITDYFPILYPLLALPLPEPSDPLATLLAEIENASPGAKVHLRPGRYVLQDTIRLKKPIQLIGSGTGQTFLAAPPGKPILSYQAPGQLVLQKITFEYTQNAPTNLLEIHDGLFLLDDCKVQGAVQDPKEANPAAIGNTGWGVWVGGTARGQLLRCQLRHNEAGGIRLAQKAVVHIEDSLCEHNGIGIAYTDSASGTAKNTISRLNKRSGIVVAHQANPILEENQCLGNGQLGIHYSGSSSGTARKNTCQKNKGHGIYVDEKAQPILEENQCLENEGRGICYEGSSSGTARKNTCQGNKRSGIYVGAQAQALLEENQCLENEGPGICYEGSSSGTARKNTCQKNKAHGIEVGEKAQPILEENQCFENELCGIAYLGDSSGTARKNTCQNNKAHGIEVNERAQPILEENQCLKNGDSGIVYFGSSSGTARKNTCQKNKKYGIYVGEKAQPILEENQCLENGQFGIHYFGSSPARPEKTPAKIISNMGFTWAEQPTQNLRAIDASEMGIQELGFMVTPEAPP